MSTLQEALKRPKWPRPAASTAVFRDGQVLIVERAKGGLRGVWSLPGGHIEPGETARAAALRELAEETGVSAEIVALADVHDVMIRSGAGALTAHYVLTVFAARWVAGEPVAATDVANARFVALPALSAYQLTPGAAAIIETARRLIG